MDETTLLSVLHNARNSTPRQHRPNARDVVSLLQESDVSLNYEWHSDTLNLTFAKDRTGIASALTPLDLPYLVLSPDALLPGETYDLSVEYWFGTYC